MADPRPKLQLYTIPPSLVVEPLVNRKRKGDLIISFGGGPLCEMTYRPLGLNSLWTLVGTAASLTQSLSFEIKESMTALGIMGGMSRGRFCLFDTGPQYTIKVFTRSAIDISGSSRITIKDKRHGIFFWVPDCAMMPFESLVKVGNQLLLGEKTYFQTIVGQRYSNWTRGKYHPQSSEP